MTDDQMPVRPAVVDGGATERPAEGTTRGEAPGGAEGLYAACSCGQVHAVPAQKAASGVAPRPECGEEGHAWVSHHEAYAPIWIRRCQLCKRIDVDDLNERIAEKLAPIEAERDGLRGKVEAVRALHTPVETPARGSAPARVQCGHCDDLCHSDSGLHCDEPYDAAWPCATIEALDGGEGVNAD